MRKRTTIDEAASELSARYNISMISHRHAHEPLDTAGELLDAYDQFPPVKAGLAVLDRIEKGRGRHSSARK